MDFRHLQTFLAAAEFQNFTKAAKSLGYAQSNVTTQIKQLEEELGVFLFERIGKNISLTSEGNKLLPYARKILSLSEEISTLFQSQHRITVGVSESVSTYLFGDILKEFATSNPDTEIFLKIADGKDYITLLSEGEIDAAIVLDLPVKSKSIHVLNRRKENIFLLSASTHDLAGKTHITADDLTHYPILLTTTDCPYRRFFEESLMSDGIKPKIALETNSIHVIKESSLCGIGLCLLPEFAVKKELIYHILERLNYKTNYPVYTQILIHQDKWISPSLESFLAITQKHLG